MHKSMCFHSIFCNELVVFQGGQEFIDIMAPKLGIAVAMVIIFVVAGRGMCDTVSIENDMGHGVGLQVQCNLGTEDLGFHTIYSGLSYVFSFQPSWWGRDVYQCNFRTKGFPVKHMRVYEGINFLDNFCLCRSCHWKVAPKGFDCENGQYHENWQ